METNVKFARIIATGMNLRTRLQNVNNLLHAYVYGGTLPVEFIDEFKKLSKRIDVKVETDRNNLVHGTWARVDGKWLLIRSAKGTRGHSQLKGFKLPRAVLPQLEPWSRDKTEAIRKKIKQARADLDSFTTKLENALPPSPHKSPRQRKQDRPSRARKNKAPLGRP